MGNLAVKADQSPVGWGGIHKQTVLIIDEANRTRAQIAQILRQKGFENSEEADNGTEAMKMLAARLQKGAKLPDLIIYNVSYQLEDRVQFCTQLRELGTPEFKRLPIILLASTANDRLNLLAEHIGSARVVIRPVSPDEMARHMGQLIVAAAQS